MILYYKNKTLYNKSGDVIIENIELKSILNYQN